MGSKTPSTSTDEANVTSDERCSKKGKVPKRINKSVRERLKREHLNELFIDLADTLELNQQNSGKASILCEATRFLKDVFGQIESLRKEHASLLSESSYITTEKNELKEETTVLQTEILKLQTEIEAKMKQTKPDVNTSPTLQYHRHHQQQQHTELASQYSEFPIFQGAGFQHSTETMPPPATVFVLPVKPNLQPQDIPDITGHVQTHSSNVSKPSPRYASAVDAWPSRLLGERLKANE